MKTRLQKTGESLQEYASEVERLANLAFSDHPATVRETISLRYFVDGLKDGETQLQVLGMWWNGTSEKKLSSSKEGREHCLFFKTGKLKYGHLAVRRLPDNEKSHHKILQIMAVNGDDKGLYVIGQINHIPSRMVVDTGANVSIIKKIWRKTQNLVKGVFLEV
ncbi:retrovirus-related Pol polyprotein from transposon 297 [Trichonephila clavipes]|nr:retrovirus-related Pol polyprotein from transposon 297 [Trichonephila clavipes]